MVSVRIIAYLRDVIVLFAYCILENLVEDLV